MLVQAVPLAPEHPEAVVLFVHNESTTRVASGKQEEGEPGDTFVALLPVDDGTPVARSDPGRDGLHEQWAVRST